MNGASEKESEIDETSALVGELPTWSIKKLVFQLNKIPMGSSEFQERKMRVIDECQELGESLE